MKNLPLSLQEVQQNSFNVLLKIKEIFEQNNWDYFLAYGTLLGAVRHKGFIPWDDDIDIWVPRPHYEQFIKYCQENKELIKPFELIHYKTNRRYVYPIARFSDSRFIVDYKNTKDYGLGLFVDIYPLDGIDNSDLKKKKKLHSMKKQIFRYSWTYVTPVKLIPKYLFKLPIFLSYGCVSLHQMIKKCDEIAKRRSFDNSSIIDCACWEWNEEGYSKDWFLGSEKVYLQFNGYEFQVPFAYDAILKSRYGDYMKLPPENERRGHHSYIAYEKQ